MQVTSIRNQFPALLQQVDGQSPIFLDGPGGAQVPHSVLTAMSAYLGRYNSNLGGAFFSSHQTVDLVNQARQTAAEFLNAPSADQIVFGPNMTSLTFSLSRAISRDWQPSDEIIVTNADHFSNVSSWQQAAQDKGAKVHTLEVNETDCRLNLAQLKSLLNANTKLLAVTYASNTTGTINDIKTIIEMAHSVGALVYVDAVHYAPHQLVDVQELNCDFLACSAYKFFGPHLGMVYGKRAHLEHFKPYKVEPATTQIPGCWETGTQSFEAMAGFIEAVEYIASLSGMPVTTALRERLVRAFDNISRHEAELSAYFLAQIARYPAVTLYGISDSSRLSERTPTFALRIEGIEPRTVSEHFGKHHICVWDGNFYAKGLCQQLGVLDKGGIIRVGCMHYNTIDELARFFTVLDELIG
jgi:cysteine desulfurase family protein (TIGR01976 family)